MIKTELKTVETPKNFGDFIDEVLEWYESGGFIGDVIYDQESLISRFSEVLNELNNQQE